MNHLDFAEGLAKQAGAIMRSSFAMNVKTTLKNDSTPVTEVDLIINTLVTEAIKATYPEHGILSEEEDGSYNAGSEWLWICDPIDGTYPFAHGIPTAVFSLALSHRNRIILSIVYDPFLDRMYSSEVGKGAFLNKQRVTVSDSDTIKNSVVGISLWNEAPYDLAPLFAEFQALGALPVNLGSNIYTSTLVSAGTILGVIYNGDKLYDVAAVELLVTEAGGKVTDLYGEPVPVSGEVRGMIATNGKVHSQFLDIIKKYTIQKK